MFGGHRPEVYHRSCSIFGMLIRNGKHRDEFYTGERVYVTELLNDAAAPQASLARCRVVAGVTTELHRLSVAEWYVIESGSGLMEVGAGEPFAVGPGDVVAIPPGTPQRITNTGETDLVLQCLCLPRFTPECYEALE
jgi:mannose-6-phosphate isomerase-like protein (cupin superfamily)